MIGRAMIEYRCDRCQRLIEQTTDVRYVVRIEVQAALEPLTRHVADDERDYLQEISEQLDGVDGAAEGVRPIEDSFEQSRYDLCSTCFEAFRERPLGQPTECQGGRGAIPAPKMQATGNSANNLSDDDPLASKPSVIGSQAASAASRRRSTDLHHN